MDDYLDDSLFFMTLFPLVAMAIARIVVLVFFKS